MLRFALIPAIAAFLFGFTSAVISGALLQLKNQFALTPWQQGMLVSVLLLGALIGSLFAGGLADRIGRKRALFLLGLLLLLGSIGSGEAGDFLFLVAARGLTGIGVGLASVVVPIYLAELAPPERRGAFVAINQFSIALGILAAYAASWLFSAHREGWQLSFLVGAIPSALLLVLTPFCPESPSWLAHRREVHYSSSVFKVLFAPSHTLFSNLCIVLVLSLLQQISGINTILYYTPQIFELIGLGGTSGALLATIGVGVVNLFATLAALLLVDRLGRKPLLFWGTLGMGISLLLLLLPTWLGLQGSDLKDLLVLLGLFFYVIFFACGLGAVTWVVISELFPTKLRGEVVAIAFFFNWLANYLISLIFLPLVARITLPGVFSLFAAISLLGALFIAYRIPETKGLALDPKE